jgi:uncharacterized protein with NRDE domain
MQKLEHDDETQVDEVLTLRAEKKSREDEAIPETGDGGETFSLS